jgi:hypothetical protein
MYQEQSSSPLGHGRHLLIQCIVNAIRNSLRILKCDLAAWRLAAYPWRSGPELYLRNGKRYQRNSNGYPDIFDHAHFKGVTPTMPDVSRLLKINMAAVKPEVDCIMTSLSFCVAFMDRKWV